MNLKKTEVIMRSFKVSVVRSMIVMVAMLMLGTSTFAQVSVTLPNVSGVAGTTGSGAITVGNLTGQNVTAFSFQISYNKSLYYITGADNNNTLVGTTLTVNPDTANGKILVAWAGATALTGSGNLVNLNFKFRQQGQQALSFDNFIFNAGTPAVTLVNNGLITIPQVIIQGGTIAARVGEKIMIPITISQVTAAENVIAYDFVATFDPKMIKINGSSLTGTLSSSGTSEINIDTTAGTIKFAWAASNHIVTNGDTLLYLTGTAIKVGTANINFTAFELNQGSPLVGYNAASVTITLNYAPTLTFSPVGPNYSVNEGATLSITLVGADQNSTDVSSLKYTTTVPTSLPSGAKLTGNIFSWTPNFNAGRQAAYSFTFKVTDVYGASSTSTISITVVNVDRAPIFTSVLPPNQIAVVNKPTPVIYSFQYEASDPDGDVVTYSLSSGPAGSSIDPNTGLFTWGPTSDQVGQMYTVTVKATDGTLTTKTSQTIAASTTITGVARVNTMPTEYNLSQNYPNPFNPTTSIQFSIPKESFVKLSVFNVIGQRIQVLVNQNMSAGNYKVNFDASKLNSGMYIYRIETADYTSVRKMLLVK
jgi:hypothetical protein